MTRSLSFVNNKMAGNRSLLELHSFFLTLESFAAAFWFFGLLLSMIITQRHRQKAVNISSRSPILCSVRENIAFKILGEKNSGSESY